MQRTMRKIVTLALLSVLSGAAYAEDMSSCNGYELARFIGNPVADMQRVRTEAVRYACEGCPMTMDYSAERLTVVYSEKTGRVSKMSCN